ncbi:hypothetical protein AgCh_005163 [Apium graveolens]
MRKKRFTSKKRQCGMKVKADRDESSPYAAMLVTPVVSTRCKRMLLQSPLIALAEGWWKRKEAVSSGTAAHSKLLLLLVLKN